MKKFIVLILAVLYLGTSTGATVHMHYCMDRLVDWALWPKKGDNCSKCGMSKTEKELAKGCCKDEQKQVKLKTDHKAAEGFQMFQMSSVAILPLHFELSIINLPSVTEENPLSHAPPRTPVPIFILNRNFRI